MDKTSIGDRFKRYENVFRLTLPPRQPLIIRVDGKAFHSLKLEKPFDGRFIRSMQTTMLEMAEQIQGCVFAYTQSDEISFLLQDFKTYQTEAWFGGNLQKIVSVSASMAGVKMSSKLEKEVYFDSRAFVVPNEVEAANYFIWRQQDFTRNSIQMVAQSLYSHKELHGKNCSELQEMIFKKGVNWNDYQVCEKRGSVWFDGFLDYEPPIFSECPQYITDHFKKDQE